MQCRTEDVTGVQDINTCRQGRQACTAGQRTGQMCRMSTHAGRAGMKYRQEEGSRLPSWQCNVWLQHPAPPEKSETTINTLPKLDMSMARWRLKSPRSLSGTSAHHTMIILVNIMVMNWWLTSFSFHVNRPPHSWDTTISDSDLETPRSRSWVWSRGNVIQSAQYHINLLPFHFTSIRPTIPEIQLFRNLTLKHPRSRSWVRSKSMSHIIPSIEPMHFLFVSHQSDQPFLRYG